MIFSKIYKTDIKFENRVIDNPKFSSLSQDTSLSLIDPVIAYNDGKVWKLVPLKLLTSYPVIYDQYYDQIKTRGGKLIISDITVTYCPFTSTVIIYFGKYTPTGELYNNNIILSPNTDKDKIIVQIQGLEYSRTSKEKTNSFIRRDEVKIMTLRNVLGRYPDCLFLHHQPNATLLAPIVETSYTLNNKILYPIEHFSKKYHPKTLVYGIEYKSNKIEYDRKYTVIVPDDATKDKSNSYNLKLNKIDEYFNPVMMEKLRDKGGIIIPCYWFAWYGMYPNSKVIKL